MRRRPRLVPALALAACGAVAGGGPGPAPAAAAVAGAAAEPHRAAVIVDTGEAVKTVCVRFAEESISGVEALQRAAVDPVFRAYPGKGAAVCSLCGTGCAGDESCLTCDPDGRFWSYSRAPAGTTGLRVSGAGASATSVHDGDVEGWIWGRGGAPGYVAVEVVCGEAPPSVTTAPTAAPTTVPAATTTAPAAGPAPAPAGATTTRGPAAGAGAPGTTVAPVATTPAPAGATPSPPATTAAVASTSPGAPAPGDLASSRSDGDGGGGGWGGVAAFGAGLGGLVAWAVALRRRRRPQ